MNSTVASEEMLLIKYQYNEMLNSCHSCIALFLYDTSYPANRFVSAFFSWNGMFRGDYVEPNLIRWDFESTFRFASQITLLSARIPCSPNPLLTSHT